MRHGFIDLVLRFHLLSVEDNEGAFVAHRITIVGSGEDSDALSVVSNLIAHVLHLMRPNDIVQFVPLQEVLGDVGAFKSSRFEKSSTTEFIAKLTELTSNTTLRRRSSVLRLWVRPKQLAHDAILGRLSVSLNSSQIVDGDLVGREESAVHDQNAVVEKMAKRKEVVDLREHIGHC